MGKKAVVAVGLGLATVAVIAATRKVEAAPPPPPTPPGEGGAGITIEILPTYAGMVALEPILEGTSRTARITVTNASTRAGLPAAARFGVKIGAKIGATVVVPETTEQYSFAAGESHAFDRTLNIPMGTGGLSISISASIYDPNAVYLTGASEAVQIVSQIIAGAIPILLIYYPTLAGWQNVATGMQVPWNVDISIAIGWKNNSNVPITGRVDLKVVRPDGTVVNPTALSGQDQLINPGVFATSVQFNPFKSSLEGTYTLTATLSRQGVVLNTSTFTLVTVADIIYGATVTIG